MTDDHKVCCILVLDFLVFTEYIDVFALDFWGVGYVEVTDAICDTRFRGSFWLILWL